MVHSPVSKAELLETLEAQKALDYEFQRLIQQDVFDLSIVRDWNGVALEA